MSGQAGRYQRSTGGLVGAMAVLVVLIVAWIGFKALTTTDPKSPVSTVDYAPVVTQAKKAADFALVAPPSLPPGWRATTVRFDDQAPQHWHLGVLTDRDRYIGLEQGDRSARSLVQEYVDEEASRGDRVDVDGRPWTTYHDSGGDLALVRHDGRATTLVVGHDVPRDVLVSYAAGLE